MSTRVGPDEETGFRYSPLIDAFAYNHESIRQLAEVWRQERLTQETDGPPHWHRVDKLGLRPWMGWLTVYELVRQDGKVVDARFRLVGTRIVDIAGYDLTGSLLSERSYSLTPGIVIGNLQRLADHAVPAVQNNLVRVLGDYAELTDRLWLPFADDDQDVRMILLYMADVRILVDQFDPARLQ